MRIGMMTDVYKPHVSGITNYISLNKRILTELSHDIYVFTFGDENYQDDENNVIRSPGLPLMDTGYYISFRYSIDAIRLLRRMDVVHVHHPFLSGSLALRYCKPRGIPIIFTNHTRYDLYAKAYFPILPNFIGESALEAYMPTFCRACELVIAPSNGMRDILKKLGVVTPIDVVPNGVDIEPLKKSIKPFQRDRWGITNEDIVLIYTGRLGPEKNLPFLLRCFSGLAQAYENVHLMIVGDGSERDNLEDRATVMNIASRTHFTGMVPINEVYSYLCGSDAFVTASVTEVHPLSVIEAMAAGLPVLGIESPGISDMIQDNKTGLLVSKEDIAEFTAKLVRMVSEHDHRKKMGEQAHNAAEKYSINRTAQEMAQRYQRVVEASKKKKPGLRILWTKISDIWGS